MLRVASPPSPLSEKGEGGLVSRSENLETRTSSPSPSGRGLGGGVFVGARSTGFIGLLFLLTAQTPPAAPADSLRPTTVKTVVALPPDTTRQRPAPAAVVLPDAPDPVTKKLAFRISGAILLLSLSTLLLYNVRSR